MLTKVKINTSITLSFVVGVLFFAFSAFPAHAQVSAPPVPPPPTTPPSFSPADSDSNEDNADEGEEETDESNTSDDQNDSASSNDGTEQQEDNQQNSDENIATDESQDDDVNYSDSGREASGSGSEADLSRAAQDQPEMATCELSPDDYDEIVNFDGERLYSEGGDTQTDMENLQLDAGTYELTLFAADPHGQFADNENYWRDIQVQLNEQYFIEFSNDGDVVATSNASIDLPDQRTDRYLGTSVTQNSVTLSESTSNIQARHAVAHGNVSPEDESNNSVEPTCIGLNKQGENDNDNEDATLRVCKIISDSRVQTDGAAGTSFELAVNGDDFSETTSFSTPLSYDTDLFGDNRNDAACREFSVAPGDYTYEEEAASPNFDGYKVPQYNDEDPENIDDFAVYNFAESDTENVDTRADGKVEGLQAGETRTITIKNRVGGQIAGDDSFAYRCEGASFQDGGGILFTQDKEGADQALYRFDRNSGESELLQRYPSSQLTEALAVNQQAEIYGFIEKGEDGSETGALVQLEKDGTLSEVGEIAELPQGPAVVTGAAFGIDGDLYAFHNGDRDTIYRIDVSGASLVEQIELSAPVGGAGDIVVTDTGNIVHISQSDGTIHVIDESGNVTDYGALTNNTGNDPYTSLAYEVENGDDVYHAINKNNDTILTFTLESTEQTINEAATVEIQDLDTTFGDAASCLPRGDNGGNDDENDKDDNDNNDGNDSTGGGGTIDPNDDSSSDNDDNDNSTEDNDSDDSDDENGDVLGETDNDNNDAITDEELNKMLDEARRSLEDLRDSLDQPEPEPTPEVEGVQTPGLPNTGDGSMAEIESGHLAQASEVPETPSAPGVPPATVTNDTGTDTQSTTSINDTDDVNDSNNQNDIQNEPTAPGTEQGDADTSTSWWFWVGLLILFILAITVYRISKNQQPPRNGSRNNFTNADE